ncbi:DUF2905 domain-containing protein [Neobacillus sp. LXY-4]|uniref:DUF2905 domain-containing protein n=1 Tax=Neobacillus sp. LXY-4 TaxID=3379826 RepID=UPI003EE2CE10
MTGLSKTIMLIGAIVFVIGFMMNFIHLGKLPGDIIIKKGNTTFYFPVVTSILLSVLLSVVFFIIGRFR